MWTIDEIYNGALDGVKEAESIGIYTVLLPDTFNLIFNPYTTATLDRKKNTKDVELLRKRWQQIQKSDIKEGKSILYIGKTDETLKKRVLCLAKYGRGEASNHHGGYPLWQIENNIQLCVEIIPCANPHKEETRRLDNYIDLYGTQPIANTSVGTNSRYRYLRKQDIYVLR